METRVDEDVVDWEDARLLAGDIAKAQRHTAPAPALAQPLRLELDVVAEFPAVLGVQAQQLGLTDVVAAERGIDDVDRERRIRVGRKLRREEAERRVIEIDAHLGARG